MDNKNVDLDSFLAKYQEEYDFLYENNDRVAGFMEAVDWFDFMYKNNPEFKEFIRKLVVKRGDAFSSDRECGAVAFACESFELF